MSIGSFIKALEVLKEDKQILVMQDLSYNNAEYDVNSMREVTTICEFSEMNFVQSSLPNHNTVFSFMKKKNLIMKWRSYEMKKEEKRYLKSKMNEYANRYFNRNKIDGKFASAHEIRKAFKSAFMLSYKLFMNRNNFWEPRYWILNGVYVKSMEADAEYLGKLKKENEELKAQIEKMKCCSNCDFLFRDGNCYYDKECKSKDHWKLRR